MAFGKVAVLGGSGFVGRTFAACSEAAGVKLKIITRDRHHARALWPLPHVECVESNPFDRARLAELFRDCDSVVNLVGILNERGDNGDGFRRAHVDFTANALAAAQDARVARFVQMSAIGAALAAPSHYLRTKHVAESLVVAARSLHTIILRPSVIFGPGDGLFGRFAPLVKWLPWLPLGRTKARFQPVYVADVARVILHCSTARGIATGTVLELGGPAVHTLRELVEYTARMMGSRCHIIALPNLLGRVQAEIGEHLPGKPLSRDNWRSLQIDSVVQARNGLDECGIVATPIEAVMPQVLRPAWRHDDYSALRRRARRELNPP